MNELRDWGWLCVFNWVRWRYFAFMIQDEPNYTMSDLSLERVSSSGIDDSYFWISWGVGVSARIGDNALLESMTHSMLMWYTNCTSLLPSITIQDLSGSLYSCRMTSPPSHVSGAVTTSGDIHRSPYPPPEILQLDFWKLRLFPEISHPPLLLGELIWSFQKDDHQQSIAGLRQGDLVST